MSGLQRSMHAREWALCEQRELTVGVPHRARVEGLDKPLVIVEQVDAPLQRAWSGGGSAGGGPHERAAGDGQEMSSHERVAVTSVGDADARGEVKQALAACAFNGSTNASSQCVLSYAADSTSDRRVHRPRDKFRRCVHTAPEER